LNPYLKTKILDEKQPQEERYTFFNHVPESLLNFNLSPDMVNLFESEVESLKNYLYANYLIIQCKQASLRVSPQTWEAIETRMLLVPSN
jgi:hypothetical protein